MHGVGSEPHCVRAREAHEEHADEAAGHADADRQAGDGAVAHLVDVVAPGDVLLACNHTR